MRARAEAAVRAQMVEAKAGVGAQAAAGVRWLVTPTSKAGNMLVSAAVRRPVASLLRKRKCTPWRMLAGRRSGGGSGAGRGLRRGLHRGHDDRDAHAGPRGLGARPDTGGAVTAPRRAPIDNKHHSEFY